MICSLLHLLDHHLRYRRVTCFAKSEFHSYVNKTWFSDRADHNEEVVGVKSTYKRILPSLRVVLHAAHKLVHGSGFNSHPYNNNAFKFFLLSKINQYSKF